MINKNVVLEIGMEEVPSKFMPSSIGQLEEKARHLLDDNRIPYDDVRAYGTPRRLVVNVIGIAQQQRDLTEEVKGPSAKIAFDKDGKPTKAAVGFANSQKVKVEDLEIKEFEGGQYVFAVKHSAGRQTKEVLRDILPDLILSLSFPKSMRWGDKNLRYVRPIRWILALYGEEVIPFEIEGLSSGRLSRGHRFLGSQNITINHADEYFDVLLREYVMVKQDERRQRIMDQSKKIAEHFGGVLVEDKELLEEIVHLVEYPTALAGSFEDKYLALPKEVVITPMKEHQRYFPIEDPQGRLFPKFIAIRNGNDAHIDIVRSGNEKVLRARLADAQFFYKEDQKNTLDENVEKLKHIVFQQSLGTIYDKVVRLKDMVKYLGNEIGFDNEQINSLLRAAHLCKADLVTNMVNEFDELQGVMGREYALLQGETKEVALAIYEHYLPRFSGDGLPGSDIGAVLSIADKIDTICGCFAVGIQPTGSQDPYALRRQAMAIVNIIISKHMHISLKELIEQSLRLYNCSDIKIKKDILDFFESRIKNIMVAKGYRNDIIEAVMDLKLYDPAEIMLRMDQLKAWLTQDDHDHIEQLIMAYNRINNLAQKAGEDNKIEEGMLKSPEEFGLWDAYVKYGNTIINQVESKNFIQALELLGNYITPINEFFDGVMVMVNDEKIRNNRLALIKNVAMLLNSVANLSRIVI
ncbi:MAG: glycine--tRNA ligase subunit beta [Mahellales bacterium]